MIEYSKLMFSGLFYNLIAAQMDPYSIINTGFHNKMYRYG
jgi:hypothetical protein